MIEISLAQEPNQSISVVLDGNRWDIVIKVGNNMMYADFTMNDVVLVRSIRLLADQAALPHGYLAIPGNFVLYTINDENPWWEKFGSSQSLLYQSYSDA